MRKVVVGIAIALGGLSSAASAEAIGLPSTTFALKWTALPTGRFTQDTASSGTRFAAVRAWTGDTIDPGLLDAAFASAAGNGERHGIAFYEMMSSWDQNERTALQRLRDTEHAYSAADTGEAHHGREDVFFAMVSRVTDATGRSVATGSGADDAALNKAYDGALNGADNQTRKAIITAQEAWSTYRDAFSAYADLLKPGSAPAVRAELAQRRIADLAR